MEKNKEDKKWTESFVFNLDNKDLTSRKIGCIILFLNKFWESIIIYFLEFLIKGTINKKRTQEEFIFIKEGSNIENRFIIIFIYL